MRWIDHAREADVAKPFAEIASRVIRKAYQQNWNDRLCLLSGWRFDSQRKTWFVDEKMLFNLALWRPGEAQKVWLHLLKTKGELQQLVDGGLCRRSAGPWTPVYPAQRPDRAWAAVSGDLADKIAELKRQRSERLAFLEVDDGVAVFIAGRCHSGVITAVSADNGAVVISYDRKKAPDGSMSFSTIDLVRVDESNFRERRDGGHKDVTIEVREAARRTPITPG
jgi:hypothetical protein